jgi:hypothetical protein
MKKMKFITNRKAVSQVVSTLMIVGIIFAMFAIIYPWAISSLTLSQSRANIWYSSQEEAAQERFVIEMACFNATVPESVDIYVRNVGEIDVLISTIYINNSVQNTIDPVLPEPVYVQTNGSNNIVVFTITYTWEIDKTYRIRAVTEKGQIIVFEAKSPS